MAQKKQQKSDVKCHPAFTRIDFYRIKSGKTWKQVADSLDVGVSALMMVKSGKRGISEKVLYRLAQAEIAEGIEEPVNNQSTMGSLEEKEKRTGQPYDHFMSDDLLNERISKIEETVERQKADIARIEKWIDRDEKELKRLTSLRDSRP